MVTELLKRPLWRAEDLGKPIPLSEHAISVCLPTWRDNVGYEEEDPRVMEQVVLGYPRFIYHHKVLELFRACEKEAGHQDLFCQVYPSSRSADRCVEYVQSKTGQNGAVRNLEQYGVVAVCFPSICKEAAKDFWQHTGEGISSRRADAILQGRQSNDGEEAKTEIKSRIAGMVEQPEENVFLFPSGMAAIYFTSLVLGKVRGGIKSVQFGFPYVDTLKLQQKIGPGTHLFPRGNTEDMEALARLLNAEMIGGLFLELPSNPLLWSADFSTLAAWARRHAFPLVVDDTLGTFVNLQLLPHADILCTSLTKYFSGNGDVMGGSVVLNDRSPFAAGLKAVFANLYEDNLWGEDAVCLAENSRTFVPRMKRINATAEAVCDYLHRHPKVERVFYPKYTEADNYKKLMKEGAGYGGLFSLLVQQPEKNASRIFDLLEISKGPSLGTSYSLCCPYTVLAHYHELAQVEAIGVSRHLIRVAVGLEDAEDLIRRFGKALEGI
jgi:cystathionine gamma-synthase